MAAVDGNVTVPRPNWTANSPRLLDDVAPVVKLGICPSNVPTLIFGIVFLCETLQEFLNLNRSFTRTTLRGLIFGTIPLWPSGMVSCGHLG